MFKPGKSWLATTGNVLQAHGGGINCFHGRHYWYGENKTGCSARPNTRMPRHAGVNCYSSSMLYDWTFEGPVWGAPGDPDGAPAAYPIMDRPHVLRPLPTCGCYAKDMWRGPACTQTWPAQHRPARIVAERRTLAIDSDADDDNQ